MTREDPSKRPTLEEVMSHSYMQKDTASADEIKDHFYETMPVFKELNEEHYNAMQEASKSWAKIQKNHTGAPQNEAKKFENMEEEEKVTLKSHNKTELKNMENQDPG